MATDAVSGAWQASIDLARALIARRVEPTLVVLGPSPTPAQRFEAQRARVPIIEASYKLEWMEDSADDVARAGEWLLLLAEALQPDVVHLNGYTHAALPWTVPTVVVARSCLRGGKGTANDGGTASGTDDGYAAGVGRGLRAATAVVASNRAMRQALTNAYGLESVRVIVNGCPAAGRRLYLETKEPVVLTAGRLWDETTNIAALGLAASHITWPVCVAGDEKDPAGRTMTFGNVRTLGRLPARDMRTWYRRSWIFAAPARHAPMGLSILEAAAAGCALVLADLPSLREHWDGAAVFVPPEPADGLLAALRALIESPTRRLQLAVLAHNRASRFTIDRAADEYVRLYQDLSA